MKAIYVLLAGTLIAGGVGIGTGAVSTDEFDAQAVMETAMSYVPGVTPTIPATYRRGEMYHYCQRNHGNKSTRRTIRQRIEVCECLDHLSQDLSTSQQRDLRWAVRAQYADLSKAPAHLVNASRSVMGAQSFSAKYSTKSSWILRRCDAKIKFGEARDH